jgi:hypothetical protein
MFMFMGLGRGGREKHLLLVRQALGAHDQGPTLSGADLEWLQRACAPIGD